jgi:hypothetical protein
MKTSGIPSLSLILLLFLFSCKSPSNFEGGHPEAALMKDLATEARLPEPPPPPVQEAAAGNELTTGKMESNVTGTSISRKIIKDGRIEMRVKDLEQGKRQTDSLVQKYKGYYAEETFNNLDYSHGFSMKIRVPSVDFEKFITEIEAGLGEMAFKNITSRDVTEEFIDLETRLKNKKNYLNRYGDLLKQARSVKDILEIEEKTRLIEEEVESVQGRLKYLNNQVDFSTLDLQLSKKNDFSEYSGNKGSFMDRLKMSLVKGWFGLITFTLFVIRIWPFWIIVGLLYYMFRSILRARKKK